MLDQYYVIRIRFLKDGTVKKSEVMEYNTYRQAEAKFHSNLATDMADDTLKGSTCMVVSAYGATMNTEHWELDPEPNND